MLRLVQILALGFLIAVAALHFATVGFVDMAGSVFETYWRETLFGGVAVIAAWLFVVTHALRPVHDGVERLIWMVDGRADQSRAAPLVLALHGYRNADRACRQRQTPKKSGLETV